MNLRDMLQRVAPERLGEDGRLSAEARVLLERELHEPEGEDVPLIVQVLIGVGTWIGALLMGFLFFALSIHEAEEGALLFGLVLMVGAVMLSRRPRPGLFLSQLVWALVLGAQTLALAGLSDADYRFEQVALVLVLMNLGCLAFVRLRSLKFTATIAAVSWFLVVIHDVSRGSLELPLGLALSAVGWGLWWGEERATRALGDSFGALAYGLPIASGVAIAVVEARWPGILVSLGWFAAAQQRGSRKLQVIALVQLLGFLSFYYYELSTPLLEKSVLVAGTGAALLTLAWMLRLWRGPQEARVDFSGARFASALLLVAISLGVVGFATYQKHQTLLTGTTVLLPLAPVDPRSLIQGDYMRLSYELADELRALGELDQLPNNGYLVLDIEEDGVARLSRVASGAGTPLGTGQQLMRYRIRQGGWDRVRLGAESFFFEEGSAELYEPARYGELLVDERGEALLIGLRDREKKRLGRTLLDLL